MMPETLSLHDTASEYASGFADTADLGALVRGDVYRGEVGLGFYLARWFPDRAAPLELLVVLNGPNLLSVGFHGVLDGSLYPVDAASLWCDWSPLATPLTAFEVQHTYPPVLERATEIAVFAFGHDPAFQVYLRRPTTALSDA